MRSKATLSVIIGALAALILHGAASAEKGGQSDIPDGIVDRSPTKPASTTYPRSIYTVDDVGMIIGGTSEDAKAKVGRLPIRK